MKTNASTWGTRRQHLIKMSVTKNVDGSENAGAKAVDLCKMIRDMIVINAQHMDGLRTECSPSAALTQQEIRALEVLFKSSN